MIHDTHLFKLICDQEQQIHIYALAIIRTCILVGADVLVFMFCIYRKV
jgi:hypothetical protein